MPRLQTIPPKGKQAAAPMASLRKNASPAIGLTEDERAIIEVIAAEGVSTRQAMALIWPDSVNWPAGKRASLIHGIRNRGQAYLQSLMEVGAAEAGIGRAQLIEMALQDREFARETGNASAAVAATKNVAMLAGLNMKEDSGGNAADPVALLEAVERLMRAKNGGDAIDVTPERRGDAQRGED